MMEHAFNLSTWAEERWMSEFVANLAYKVQDRALPHKIAQLVKLLAIQADPYLVPRTHGGQKADSTCISKSTHRKVFFIPLGGVSVDKVFAQS